jgi:internalin A
MKAVRETIVVLSIVFMEWLAGPAAAQTNVIFPDHNLEVVVRSALGKPTGSLATSDLQMLTSCSAYSRNITNLSGLEWAGNLRSLGLTGNAIRDLTPLQGLNGLVDLALDRNNISDLSWLAGLTNLSSLALGENPISDFSILSGLTNLTRLSLNQGSITDLSVLQNLKRLTSLNVHGNGFADISPLVQLTNLNSLDLRWNTISNCALLSAFTNLTRLYLGGNSISNLISLKPLTQLTFLNVDDDRISDLSPLAALTNLNYLVLSGNPGITNYPVLSGLAGLVNLELRANSISNLAFVSGLSRLSFADLANNSITNLSPLDLLTNLTAVNLSGNPNTNYVPGLTTPSSLWLFNESITNVAFLTNMTQLTSLGLDDNLIVDPSPLNALTNLNYLGLSRNPIANFGAIAALTKLTGLGIEGNSNSNLSFIQGLTSLQNLSIRNNRFKDLTALAGLTNLGTVYAAYNRLTNIVALTNLRNLSRVELFGNLLDVSAGSSASTVIQNLQSRGVEVDYLPTNQPPILSTLPTWYIPANKTSSLSFYASDALVSSGELTMTANSSNPGLVPNSSITFGGTNSSRLFTVTPNTSQVGASTVTLTASQPPGGLSTSRSILVTVLYPTNVVLEPNLADVVSTALGQPGASLTSVDLMSLTGLDAHNANISNLSGLEWASNLMVLYFSGNTISDVAPLRNLTGLVSLSLNNNLVANVSPLVGLTNLSFLDLSWNPLTNYSALSGLTNPVSLYLAGDSITNVSILTNLTQMVALDLSWNPVTNYPALSGLTNLASLKLADDSVTNLSFLTNLSRLATLDLSSNGISDISRLRRLTNLTFLYLQQNRLTNTGPLTRLPHLSFVDLTLNLLDSAAVGILQSYGVAVNFSPQRSPPEIDVRTNWVVQVNTNAVQSFRVMDTGPPGQHLSAGASSSSSDLAVNLTPAPSQDGAPYWTLAVTSQIATNASRWITLTATNDVGLSTNIVIFVELTPLVPVTRRWFGNTNLTWSSGGDASWFGQGIISQGGHPVAQSAALANYQTSWLQTTVEGPGRLTFWWKVSSESNYDWFRFSVGAYSSRISGEVDWLQQTVNVPPGIQTLNWSYTKDSGVSGGLDAAWLAQVIFVPGIWLEISGGVTNMPGNLLLHAVPDSLYEIQVSTNLVNWSSLAVVVPTSTEMPFLDTTAATGVHFYRLHGISPSSIWLGNPTLTNGSFQFALHSPPNLRFGVQVSTSLTSWTTLTSLTNTTGTALFNDTQSTGSSSRFYRVVLLP